MNWGVSYNVRLQHSYYSLLSEVLLTQKTCHICCSLLVVFIPWRSLSNRRNVSEKKRKSLQLQEVSLCAAKGEWLVFVKKISKRNFCFVVYFIFLLNLVIYFYPRPLPASRDPRHLDILRYSSNRFESYFFFRAACVTNKKKSFLMHHQA